MKLTTLHRLNTGSGHIITTLDPTTFTPIATVYLNQQPIAQFNQKQITRRITRRMLLQLPTIQPIILTIKQQLLQ